MKPPTFNPAHQLVIITRLAEYCQWRGAILRYENDPWNFMRQKLLQTEEPLANLKRELLQGTRSQLLKELRAGSLTDEHYGDYKHLLEQLLNRGDFADVAIHLSTAAAGPMQASWVDEALQRVTPTTLFIEEGKPAAARSPAWEKLIEELTNRLGLDQLGKTLSRKPRTPRRKAMVLRRVRHIVAEYCTVVHIPTNPSDTFSPFMLARIEGLIAANLRFLNLYR